VHLEQRESTSRYKRIFASGWLRFFCAENRSQVLDSIQIDLRIHRLTDKFIVTDEKRILRHDFFVEDSFLGRDPSPEFCSERP